MSTITDPAPPVPDKVELVEISPNKKMRLTPSWRHWFIQIREKINAINQSLYDLSTVVGSGLATKNSDGTWSTTSIVPVDSGGTGLNAVGNTNFLRGTGGTTLEERTPTQVRTDIAACPAITNTTTSASAGGASALPATPLGYADVVIAGTVRKVPFY